jgi:hypothetical protein
MSCKHCCYAVGNGKPGEHMPLEVFKEILKKWYTAIDEKDGFVVLGGGEPTLHPQFWDIVGASYPYGMTWLATNGSNKKDALTLCEMAKRGALHAVLSLDKWHDPIDEEVVKKFTEGLDVYYHGAYKCMYSKNKQDKREIRTVIIPLEGGRSRCLETTRKGCPCPGIHFKPPDKIFPCGCDDAPQIGTVDTGITDIQYKYYNIANGCHKKVNLVYSGESVVEPTDKESDSD